jgi:ribonuclease III
MQEQQSIERIISYSFTKPQLLEEAFQAAGVSVSAKGIKGNKEGNKRLALVGDALIHLLILDKWYLYEADTGKSSSV